MLLARLQAHPAPLQVRLAREVQLAQATLQLAIGDHLGLDRWARQRAGGEAPQLALIDERELRLIARRHIAGGDPDAALVLLAPMLATAEAAGRQRCALEIRALLALADDAAGRRTAACRRLRGALLEAAATGFQRLLLDLGPGMHTLLGVIAASERAPQLQTYLRELQRACGVEPSGAAPAAGGPLSPQEARVLGLLAAGRTPPEIARELIVSVNTVRTQVQSSYRKLDVHSRVAAIAVARQLGLLSDNQR